MSGEIRGDQQSSTWAGLLRGALLFCAFDQAVIVTVAQFVDAEGQKSLVRRDDLYGYLPSVFRAVRDQMKTVRAPVWDVFTTGKEPIQFFIKTGQDFRVM